MCITATGKFGGHELKDVPVLNPGDWFGKTWLLEIGGSYWPLFLIAVSDSVQDAIDVLADSKFGSNIIVDDTDLSDYPEENRHYSGSGRVLDLDHLLIHGQDGGECPFPCLYHGEGLPEAGMKPGDYWRRDDTDVSSIPTKS
jgi:hypothetical protein